MSEQVALIAGAVGILYLSKVLSASAVPAPTGPPKLFFHIKHEGAWPNTLGKVRQIYSTISSVNKTGLNIGVEPQCVADWATQKSYLSECAPDIPVMLTVFSSDGVLNSEKSIDTDLIAEAMSVCPVFYLRFHEVISWYRDSGLSFPVAYVQDVLAFARANNVPLFWNEWDYRVYSELAGYISGYEDLVIVSFGTNCNLIEPWEGYQKLQVFQRKAASVQSWYWYTRGYGSYLQMPPTLMAQHTLEAFQAGCEIVQYEPYSYFFDNEQPYSTLQTMLAAL